MAKKAIQPVFPIQHEFLESLKRYQGEVSMLLSVVEILVDADSVKMPDAVRVKLRERIEALRNATHD